jgi:hypothetical protein
MKNTQQPTTAWLQLHLLSARQAAAAHAETITTH